MKTVFNKSDFVKMSSIDVDPITHTICLGRFEYANPEARIEHSLILAII